MVPGERFGLDYLTSGLVDSIGLFLAKLGNTQPPRWSCLVPGTKKPSIAHRLAKIKKAGKGGSTEVSLQLLADLGTRQGEWTFDTKAQLERMLEWVDHVELFVRVYASIKLYALGYLPAAGGVDSKTWSLDENRYKNCKLHGALLCVTQTSAGKFVPIGPNHIRNRVNEAAVRAFTAQEGRELTAEEVGRITHDAADIRRAIDYLEELGMVLRTDNQDAPLRDFRGTEEGRKYLATLSGENKIRVYLYLKPQPSKVAQGRHMCLPSEIISNKLQELRRAFSGISEDPVLLKEMPGLYRSVLRLGLDLEPVAFAGDPELQSLVRADQEHRRRAEEEWNETLRAAVLAKYPSAAPPDSAARTLPVPESSAPPERRAAEPPSAVPNSPGTGRDVKQVPTVPPASARGTAEEEEELVSRPRARAAVAAGNGEGRPTAAPPAGTGDAGSAPPVKPATTEELAPLAEAMATVLARPESADVKKQFGVCRDEVPDCTPKEAADWILRVIQRAKKGIGNWPRYWIAATGNREDGGFRKWCLEQREFDQRERPNQPFISEPLTERWGDHRERKPVESDRERLLRLRRGNG